MELVLIPIFQYWSDPFLCGDTLLHIEEHKELFEYIKKIPQYDLSVKNLHTLLHKDKRKIKWGDTYEDAFDDPLKWTENKNLIQCFVSCSKDYKTRAILAYLTQLPESLPIIIYWS